MNSNLHNPFIKLWKDCESNSEMPRFARKIIVEDYNLFEKKVLSCDDDFCSKVVDSLYSGDVYVLKKAFTKKFMFNLQDKVFNLWSSSPSTFHKMLEGCPDFHRIQDEEIAKKYVFESIRQSYYWFHWNGDPMGVIPEIEKKWGIFKFLGGFRFDEYCTNTPKNGVVDRYQVARYLRGIGRSDTHTDPYQNQKFFISGFMSKRGVSYDSGGFYVVGEKNKFFDVEDYIEIGDISIGYATVMHGVALIDKGHPVDWKSKDGRWWLGLYSNSTDHVKNRATGKKVILK